jgi:hypothetical protein
LTDEDVLLVAHGSRSAPPDPDLKEIRPAHLIQTRFDLDLRERDVELLANELLDPLQVRLVVADEDGISGLISLDRDPLGQQLWRDSRRLGRLLSARAV